MQSVMAEDRPNVGLTVIVLKTADHARASRSGLRQDYVLGRRW
jgi:hypothetical protein